METSHTADKRQTVRYVLTTGEDASYVGMASIYRDYLLNEEGLTSSAKAGNAPLVVELFGGVMSQQYVFGFPVKRVALLTTFEDAQTILNALKEAGVDQVLLNYTYWNKDATGAAIQTALKPEGTAGRRQRPESAGRSVRRAGHAALSERQYQPHGKERLGLQQEKRRGVLGSAQSGHAV